jgi:hypothetical protein
VSAGFSNVCAIGNNDRLYCGTSTAAFTEVARPSGVNAIKSITGNGEMIIIDARNDQYSLRHHRCAIGDDNKAYCMYSADVHQLGNGSTASKSALTLVTFPSGVTSWASVVAGAYHTVALAGTSCP